MEYIFINEQHPQEMIEVATRINNRQHFQEVMMAFNIQITATGSNAHPAQIARSKASGKSAVQPQPVSAGLITIPEDRNIRKFPVRIFEVRAED